MRYKNIIYILLVLCAIAYPVVGGNDTLKMPSPVRGWDNAPPEAKTWAQTILDWSAMVAAIVAIGCIVFYYIKGRVADNSGSIQGRNESTTRTIEAVIGLIVLIVAIAFIWAIFWK